MLLFFLQFFLLPFCILKHPPKLLPFSFLFLLLFLILFFFYKLIILHSNIFEFLKFLPSLFFSLFEFEIDGFLFLLFALYFCLLFAVSHIKFGLILLNLLQFLFILFLHLHSDLVLHIILLLHGIVVLLFLSCLHLQSFSLLFNKPLHLLVNNLLLL